jgi:hypothetical protein
MRSILLAALLVAGGAQALLDGDDVRVAPGQADFTVRLQLDAVENGTHRMELLDRPGFNVTTPAFERALVRGDRVQVPFEVQSLDPLLEGRFTFSFRTTSPSGAQDGTFTLVVGEERDESLLRGAPGPGLAVTGLLIVYAAARRR